MAISHVKSNTIGDMTGTVTVLNSQGSTATRAATDFVRPSDWNSVHNQFLTLSGNTSNSSAFSGSNIIWQGGNNITLSGTTAAGVATVVISGPNAPAVLSQSGGVSNLGNTAGTSGIASGAQVRLLFAGGNNVTLSQSVNGASATITVSGAAFQSQSGGISNLGNSAGTSGIASGAAMRLLFAGGNNVTLSQSVNGASATITISGANTAAQTNQSLGLYASSQSTGQSSSSTVDARSLTIVGQGNISVGMSAGSLLISGAGGGGGIAASIGGNSTSSGGGYSNITSGTMYLLGGPNITLSQDGRSISISAPAPGGATGALTVGLTNLGNTAGTSGMVSSQLVLVGGNNITLSGSVNGQSATISVVAAAGGGGLTVSEYNAYRGREHVVGQIGSNSVHVQPYPVECEVRHSYVFLGQHLTATSNSSGSFTVSYHVGLYTLNGSTLSLLSSTSASMGATFSGTAGSYSWYAGFRHFVIPWTNTISAGRYWLGVLSRTSASPAGMTLSQLLLSQPNSAQSGYFGSASATSRQMSAFLGIVGTTTTALPAAISSNHIIGTGSLGLRQPVVHFGVSAL